MTRLHGADISHYQGSVNFSAFSGSFVVAKATESTNYRDSKYTRNRNSARKHGLLFAAYHFARGGDPEAEADYFLRHAGLDNGEIPVLDWEISHHDADGWCARFLERVNATTGTPGLIYMNNSTKNSRSWAKTRATGAGLWGARYGASMNGHPWPRLEMLQYTAKGSIGGVSGNVDLDYFYGSKSHWRSWGVGGSAHSGGSAHGGGARGFIASGRAYIGYQEQPPWSDKTIFGEAYGWNGVYWCVIYLCALAKWYGLRKNVDYPWTASVSQAEQWAQANGKWSHTPHVGDWVTYSYSHIEVVTKVEKNRVKVLGGNTTKVAGVNDRNGGGVWEKWRPRNSSIDGYIRIDYSRGGIAGGSAFGGLLGMGDGYDNYGSHYEWHVPEREWHTMHFDDGRVTHFVADGRTRAFVGNFRTLNLPPGHTVQVRPIIDDHHSWGKDDKTYGKASYNRDHGRGVWWLQRYLNQEHDAGLTVDGKFGPATENAVQDFQRANGLKTDGVVGPSTKAKLPNNRREETYAGMLQEIDGTGGGTYKPVVFILSPNAVKGQNRRVRFEAQCFDAGVVINRHSWQRAGGN